MLSNSTIHLLRQLFNLLILAASLVEAVLLESAKPVLCLRDGMACARWGNLGFVSSLHCLLHLLHLLRR